MLLSVVVSIFSSTMALQTAQIARRTERELYYHIALFTGALALGGGVWAMHFIGMLAYELPTQVSYSLGLTLFSMMPACVASWLALRLLAMPTVSRLRLLGSGTLVGAGIGAMHYIGMAAMRTPLEMRFEPFTFVLSLFVAVALAILALWVRYGLQRTSWPPLTLQLSSGMVMGIAIAGMHYTGMAAVRFIGEPGEVESQMTLSPIYASLILSSFTVTVTVMVVAINGMIRSHELYWRVREGSSRLRATLDTAVDAIITINSKGLIQDYNRSAERLFGWTAEEVMGRNIKMLMPEPYQSAHDGYLHNYMTTGKRKIIGIGREVVGLRKNGTHMPMRLAVGRVDLPGELLFVGFVSDISDRHELEASLRETAERAEQAAAAKTTFLANMSHEIRTPMNSIIGFTELLLQGDLTSGQRSQLNTVRQSARSLLRLINDILDTTKMEKGELEFESLDFSLKGLALQIESSMRLSAQSKRLDFVIRYSDDMPEYFRGDPLRLLQILTNLVGNAIKFTEAGSVEVAFSQEDGIVHVRVSDTGIGMTPQQAELIFAPFAQADASISRRFGGTGLGTTIARQLVEQMGGTIEVESEPGRGSTFHVRLALPQGRAPERPDSQRQRVALPPLRMLIADDVPQNLELLGLVLEREGHSVTQVSDGHQAVDSFIAGNFDVVLMDVHMPGQDGLQATRLIRQFERQQGRAPVPVIALTASVMAEDKQAARQAGMNGFASKPLDPPQLFDEIARVLDLAVRGQAVDSAAAATQEPSVINWQGGLALWGDRDRLVAALRQFLDTAREKYPLPGPDDTEFDPEQLRFSLHGLRGAASNLALPEVAGLAGTLETQLRAGGHEDLRAQCQVLLARLDQVGQALTAEAGAGAAGLGPASGVAPGAVLRNGAALRPSLERLLDITRRSELDDALLDAVCDGLEIQGARADAQALRAALDAFEFQDAAALLESFKRSLA